MTTDAENARTTGHAWRDGRCVNCNAETGRPFAEPCPAVASSTSEADHA